MRRTFGQHLWFVVEMDPQGNVISVEEHDWREGGLLPSPDSGKTWEETFIAHASSRIQPAETTKAEAEAFLAEMRKDLMA